MSCHRDPRRTDEFEALGFCKGTQLGDAQAIGVGEALKEDEQPAWTVAGRHQSR
jgi:hypothetical protein